jgi:hypothetical protein
MSKEKFPSPRNLPAHVLHRSANGEEVLTHGEDGMLVPMTEDVAAWVQHALVMHLHFWQSDFRTRALAKMHIEEARAFTTFLHDLLPENRRTKIPSANPRPPTTPDRKAA